MEKEDVIFTPHYCGERYKHHACSGCGYAVRLPGPFYSDFYFGDSFKYCPNCGAPVVRFAVTPVFDEPPFAPDLFQWAENIYDEMCDKISFHLFCELTGIDRKEIVKKAQFALSLEKAGGRKAGMGAKLINELGDKKLTHWDVKRLSERVKKNQKV